MKLGDMLKDRLKGDEELAKKCELIKDFGMALALSGIITVALFITMTFIFFYSSPLLLVWSLLLILLKLRVCDSGIQISLEKIIRKRLKLYLTFE